MAFTLDSGRQSRRQNQETSASPSTEQPMLPPKKKYARNTFVCVCRFRLRLLHVTSTSIIAQIFCQICTPRRVERLPMRLCGSCGGGKWQ